MHINYNKTKCMLIGSRQKLQDLPQISLKINDHDISSVTKQKLLGLVIDDKLTWSAHIDHLCSTLSSKKSLLRQLADYVSVDVFKKCYQGYMLPLIDYGSVTWSGTSLVNIERICKLQKRAARIILHADYDTPPAIMFRDLEWQPVNKRLANNKAILIYKALNHLTPEYITAMLMPISETHSRNLRSSTTGTLSVPRSRTSFFDISFISSAQKLWNSLPISVRLSPSINDFKDKLKGVL